MTKIFLKYKETVSGENNHRRLKLDCLWYIKCHVVNQQKAEYRDQGCLHSAEVFSVGSVVWISGQTSTYRWISSFTILKRTIHCPHMSPCPTQIIGFFLPSRNSSVFSPSFYWLLRSKYQKKRDDSLENVLLSLLVIALML